jgi:hypothetical protein
MDSLKSLAIIRLHLSSTGASPEQWQALGDAYQRIGALSNAAACQRRAAAAGLRCTQTAPIPVEMAETVHA